MTPGIAIRAALLGVGALVLVVVALFVPVVVNNPPEAFSLLDLAMLTAVLGTLSFLPVITSLLGATIVIRLWAACDRPYLAALAVGLPLGWLLGIATEFAITTSHPFFPSWAIPLCGVAGGATWGVLAPGAFGPRRAA